MQEKKHVIGIDEAGMGPWAGPLCVAGVVWTTERRPPETLTDSKQLREQQREALFEELQALSVAYSIQLVPAEIINTHGLAKAKHWAILKIVQELKARAQNVVIDGVGSLQYSLPTAYIIKGDTKVTEISAASILAKVTRDRYMREMHQEYPEYAFDAHKGYGTKGHQKALRAFGPLPEHRIWYAPVLRLSEAYLEEHAK